MAHNFAEQSVVCYTLCKRCRENAVAAVEGKGVLSGRKAGGNLRSGAAKDSPLSSADRAYMKTQKEYRKLKFIDFSLYP
ncbi:Hypothetical protein CKL_2867 [Clostridium kluyveri DSM 555]|uniref:Uncharacterized protein n=1 Tax=Clostridium kluyveri (strain ATCC 8527 / DSM 555 / NBRC 12016 / NCIMB 10680 / K1) TaxID=431943 RepID=A5N183_CLOK5|nr:Hypothetical protein CKL_2867 [Clostridium kluyveri DSM 555]